MRHDSREGDLSGITRRRAILGTSAAGLAALSGCLGGGDDDGTPELTASGWGDETERSTVQANIDRFDERHEDIEVTYSPIADYDQFNDQLQTQAGAGEAPDVFYLSARNAPRYVDAGVVENLTPYVEETEDFDPDDFHEPVLDAFTFDGDYYGFPFDYTVIGLFYNQQIYDDLGLTPPETWDEFRNVLETIDEEGDVEAPLVLYSSLAHVVESFIQQNGGRVMTEDNDECVIGSDEAIETLEFFNGLREDGLLYTFEDLAADGHAPALGEGEAAHTIAGVWILAALRDVYDDAQEHIDVAPVPAPSDGERVTKLYTTSWSVYSQSDHPDAAWELASYLLGDEAIWYWSSETAIGLSSRKEHMERDFYQENERYLKFLEMTDHAQHFQFGLHHEGVMNRLHPAMESIMTGSRSPRDALESVEQEINSEVL